MRLHWIADLLDSEFNVASNEEDLTAFSVLDECREYVDSAFLKGATGLFTQGDDSVRQVITGVFLTNRFLKRVPSDSLVVTHHHFDYFEDDRGLQPIRRSSCGLCGIETSPFTCFMPRLTRIRCMALPRRSQTVVGWRKRRCSSTTMAHQSHCLARLHVSQWRAFAAPLEARCADPTSRFISTDRPWSESLSLPAGETRPRFCSAHTTGSVTLC